MADERKRERDASDQLAQDGLGRDAAHGGGSDATSGGSYGRNPGRSGDDLLETGEGSGGARRGADLPRGTDEHAADARDARDAPKASGRTSGDAEPVDLDELPESGRREPGR